MAKQRYINTKFWTDSYISVLDPIEKLLFLYLLTSPMTNICGIYEVPLKRIAFDVGLDLDVTKNILDRFEKNGKILYRNGWVAIKNFIKHQAINPKVQAGINYELKDKPKELVDFVNKGLSIPTNKINRKKISKSKRNKILERDKYKCQICGVDGSPINKNGVADGLPNGVTLEIDHIKPVRLGGGSEESNLRVLCSKCNGKRNAELKWNKDGSVENKLSENMGGLSYINSNFNINSNNTSKVPKTLQDEEKKELNKKIVEVIDLFKEINPSYQRWFANKTQRASVERLLELNGFEKLQKVIGILPKTNKMTYMPTITTPSQLEDKWASLESNLLKKKVASDEKNKSRIIIPE